MTVETKTPEAEVKEVKAPESKSADSNQAPPPAASNPSEAKQRRLIPIVILLIAAAILVLIISNFDSWTGRQNSQRTDDAFMRADITPLSTRVSGIVTQVAVEDYQKVKAGDLLVRIKDDDYRAQVKQAEAAVEAARAALQNNLSQKAQQESRIAEAQAGVEAAVASIAQAQADVVRTVLEKKRQEALVDSGSATRQKLEQVTADEARFAAMAQQARAGLVSRQSELEAQRRQVAVLDAQEAQLNADLKAKEEAVIVARTNLDYTRIVAPTDGIVGERKVRVGQLVSPGTQVISLVEKDLWVQANYKETQLTNVRRGDSAQITVDTFPGLVLQGHVAEIAPASGSQFALLPPDNATGNFTKIVQRIPVKILIDHSQHDADRLRAGMSVIVKINSSGKKK
jgi:membrane fusion protein, multidrug efflux system